MTDIIAWKKYKDYNWVYNKFSLCNIQDISWWPCPVEPEIYPCIMRPLINLGGMGSEVFYIGGKEDFKENSCYGYFSTPFIDGVHRSHDYDVEAGVLKNETVFIGYSNKQYLGCFNYWELLYKNREPELFDNLKLLLEKLGGYTGPLNIECIDNIIIECHLRRGDSSLIKDHDKPFYMVPIWGNIYDDDDIDVESLKEQDGVIDVIKDDNNLSKTGISIQRKGLVLTKLLPDDFKYSCNECVNI